MLKHNKVHQPQPHTIKAIQLQMQQVFNALIACIML